MVNKRFVLGFLAGALAGCGSKPLEDSLRDCGYTVTRKQKTYQLEGDVPRVLYDYWMLTGSNVKKQMNEASAILIPVREPNYGVLLAPRTPREGVGWDQFIRDNLRNNSTTGLEAITIDLNNTDNNQSGTPLMRGREYSLIPAGFVQTYQLLDCKR